MTAMSVPLLLAVIGCVPMQAPASPWIRAQVVDANTHLPINAVTVTTWSREHPEKQVSGETDKNGTVTIAPSERTVWVLPVPYDFIAPGGPVRFTAPGYQSLELDASTITQAYVRDHKPVELTRRDAPAS